MVRNGREAFRGCWCLNWESRDRIPTPGFLAILYPVHFCTMRILVLDVW